MGETTNQIETHIRSTREDLGANLQELEYKVKSVTDWRQYFQRNPIPMIGVAFGGGVVLAVLTSGSSRSRVAEGMSSRQSRGASAPTVSHRQKQQVLETWENIKSALIAAATMQFKSFLGEVVPGFHEQFARSERARAGSPSQNWAAAQPPHNAAADQPMSHSEH